MKLTITIQTLFIMALLTLTIAQHRQLTVGDHDTSVADDDTSVADDGNSVADDDTSVTDDDHQRHI